MGAGRGVVLAVMLAAKHIFESGVRVVGPIFVVLALVLISGAVAVHFVHNIPFYTPYSSWGTHLL